MADPVSSIVRSKHTLEGYLKQSGVPHGILRLGCFFDNMDDPANWNPLAERSVKMLSGKPIKQVALCHPPQPRIDASAEPTAQPTAGNEPTN